MIGELTRQDLLVCIGCGNAVSDLGYPDRFVARWDDGMNLKKKKTRLTRLGDFVIIKQLLALKYEVLIHHASTTAVR